MGAAMDIQHRSGSRGYTFMIGISALLVVGFALWFKGDVKAGIKVLGVEVFLDTKDRLAPESSKPTDFGSKAPTSRPAQIP